MSFICVYFLINIMLFKNVFLDCLTLSEPHIEQKREQRERISMPPRKNKKITVVQEQEALPDAEVAPEGITEEVNDGAHPIEHAAHHQPEPVVEESNVNEPPRDGDGEAELNAAPQPSHDSPPIDAAAPCQEDSALSDIASPIFLPTAEGDDGGDTREGSAGNPNFANTDTDALPLADTNTVAALSNSGEEVLGGDNVAVEMAEAPPQDIVQVDVILDEPSQGLSLTSPSFHAESTRYISGPYELGLSNDADDEVPEVAVVTETQVEDAQSERGDGDDDTGAPILNATSAGAEDEVLTDQVVVDSSIEATDDVSKETKVADDIPLPPAAAASATSAATVALIEEVKMGVVSLKNYVDARLDRCHVSILDTEDQMKVLSNDSIPASIQRCEQGLRDLLSTEVAALRAELQVSSTNLSAAAEQTVAEAYDSLAGAIRDATVRVEDGYQQTIARVETEHSFLISQISGRVAALDDRTTTAVADINSELSSLKNSVEQLEQRLVHAMRMEVLPPADPMPSEGTKMRLVIAVDCPGSSSASKTVLVPVTDAATVGMLKREVLRRAVQQSIVPVHMQALFVFSKTVVILDGITLFEEDTLADVGIAANDKLVIQSSDPQLLSSAHDVNSVKSLCAPPPLMSSIAFDTTVSALSVSGGAAELLSPVQQQSPTPARAAAAPPVSLPVEHISDVVAIFLDAESAEKLSEQESLERRLNTELVRMELEPLKREEENKRVTILKAAADKVRITLLDRATYSHVDYERRVARGALEKINEAIGTGATSAGIAAATLSAKAVLAGLSNNVGEEDRISAMEAAAKTERGRKERILEDLKDLIFTVRHRMRIPPEFYGTAEHLLFAADRAILLAPSSTVKDVDDVHKEFSEFVDKLRQK
jgi:hypothetical protein